MEYHSISGMWPTATSRVRVIIWLISSQINQCQLKNERNITNSSICIAHEDIFISLLLPPTHPQHLIPFFTPLRTLNSHQEYTNTSVGTNSSHISQGSTCILSSTHNGILFASTLSTQAQDVKYYLHTWSDNGVIMIISWETNIRCVSPARKTHTHSETWTSKQMEHDGTTSIPCIRGFWHLLPLQHPEVSSCMTWNRIQLPCVAVSSKNTQYE